MPSSASAGSSGTGSSYQDYRAALEASGEDSRVEVNQRALIDKILARYASAGAVYRELLQNSNDAGATAAELRFATGGAADSSVAADNTSSASNSIRPLTHNPNATAAKEKAKAKIVTQVVYRNNGQAFRPQDWDRLRKIAEGNPDPTKVGAFGVGAYTMFSICEEPMVLSGNQVLMFLWKGDSLWTKTAQRPAADAPQNDPWTTFCLPSRDPYPLPDLAELGEFLAASLTFTQSLQTIRVFVNEKERLSIVKTILQHPRPVQAPRGADTSKSTSLAASWFSSSSGNRNAGGTVVTQSPLGFFRLRDLSDVMESVVQVAVRLDTHEAVTQARFVTATAQTNLPRTLVHRMQRVTKKNPPSTVPISLFLNYDLHDDDNARSAAKTKTKNLARVVTQSLAPPAGAGRIFIGFRTSQTTGLAAHVSAPFVPTVEREAMDLQDAALRQFNLELLQISGILLRLVLDHAFGLLDTAWQATKEERDRLEAQALAEDKRASSRTNSETDTTADETEGEDDEDSLATNQSSTTKGRGLFGFARFMARGVKKRIVSVVSTVGELLDDGSDLLRPSDPRALVTVERQAIALMQAYCPHRSTPDPQVGTALAEGFQRCLPQLPPPVLTRSGVLRSDWARLPSQGIQAFCPDKVIRQVVYDNATEYHDYIAQCRKLQIDDLLEHVAQHILSEEEALRLLQWWRPFHRTSSAAVRHRGSALKDLLRFSPTDATDESAIVAMRNWLFYVDTSSLLHQSDLPLPETVIDSSYQDKIGIQTLNDSSLSDWFSPIPMEIWSEFIAHHDCLGKGRPEDELLRIDVLTTLHKEYSRRPLTERNVYGSFCQSLLTGKPCLPFDSTEPTQMTTDEPRHLYLYSAELKAFEGVGSFRKVAFALKNAGVGEDFLLALGVRKSVSIDFLFSSLDTLQWSNDPRPLVEYLRQATLTNEDLHKLMLTRYLPAENDSKTYAPSELFLPSLDLRTFPFCKLLQWPTESEVSERSENGRFLVQLGMQTLPKLTQILEYLTESKIEDTKRRQCLDFVSSRLNPKGVYYNSFTRMSYAQKKKYRFLPCSVHEPMTGVADRKSLLSAVTCYSEDACGVMGFPIVDPDLGDSGKLYGSLFQCAPEPESRVLLRQLLQLVEVAKNKQNKLNEPEEYIVLADRIESCFNGVFEYLSHRSSDFSQSELASLKSEAFLPCRVNQASIVWFKPTHIFFRQEKGRADTLTEELFQLIKFSPFLAAAGVKQEATTRELFQLIMDSPKAVMNSLGSEKKYRALLRRIAAQPPFSSVSQTIRKAPFLIAYSTSEKADKESKSDEALTYQLAAADDIYIIDNSFFGRMFPVMRAPHESDLEDFYAMLGSNYISKSVDRRYEHAGKATEDTALARALKERIIQRAPLLLSPHVTTRPMVDDAAVLLDAKSLDFFQASSLMAVYSLRGVTRRTQTTCFSRKVGRISLKRNAIYVVENFDWFDVGYAIGDLILQRCQLEDAFFISSLLDAPLEQLRSRGFPVDRILQPRPITEPEPKPSPQSVPVPTKAMEASHAEGASNGGAVNPPTGPSEATDTVENSDKATIAGAKGPQAADKGVENKLGQEDKPAKLEKSKGEGASPPAMASNGMEEILMQMFPDADQNFVRGALGKDPTMEDVRQLAEAMSQGNYPKISNNTDTTSVATTDSSTDTPAKKEKKRVGLRGKLGKAFGGLRGSNFGGASPPPTAARPPPPQPPPGMSLPVPPVSGIGGMSGMGGGGDGVKGPASNSVQEKGKVVSPASDASAQTNMERMLQQKVAQSAKVSSQNIEAPDTLVTSVPAELDRGETCEVMDGHSLCLFTEYRDGKTATGIPIFSTRSDPSSATFLAQHTAVLEIFGQVLAQLAHVYDLRIDSIAIFYEPAGRTIAFNLGRSIYYNLRFFYALHYHEGQAPAADCYSYWFVTTAHELSHNLVSAHNKEHGFYTESYTTLYLPKLAALLAGLGT